jgi:hypothetical protein
MKNRKREICTSGSVRDEDGQPPHLLGRAFGYRRHPSGIYAGRSSAPSVRQRAGVTLHYEAHTGHGN